MEDISSTHHEIPEKELLESSLAKEEDSNTDLQKIELSNLQTETETEGISTKGSEIFEVRMEPKPSETPPLLLLDTKSARMEADSVFTGDLSTMPDQILAESPKHDDLDASTENEIASNIEEQLKEFDGSDDDTSFGKQVKEDTRAVTKEISQPLDIFELDASDDDSQSKPERTKNSEGEQLEMKESETFPIEKQITAEEDQTEVLTVSENEEDEQKQPETTPTQADSTMEVDEKLEDMSIERSLSDTPVQDDAEKDVSMESKDGIDDDASNVEPCDIEMQDDNSKSSDIKTISKSEQSQDKAEKSQTTAKEEQESTVNEENILQDTMVSSAEEETPTAAEKSVHSLEETELENEIKGVDKDAEKDAQIDEEKDMCQAPASDSEEEAVLITIETGKKEENEIGKTRDDTDANDTRQSASSEITAEDDPMEEEAGSEPRTLEINELEIKELDTDVKDEKCFKCRKAKNCRYKFIMFSEEKFLCDLKCVNAFRLTSKEQYVLLARKCIYITSFLGSVQSCMRCKARRTCMYRFKDTESGVYSYLCTSACINAFIGKNIEKYVVRRRKYIVEEIQERKEQCEQCREVKPCKYAFRSDNMYVFLCSEDCFNDMSKDDPDRYRLKPLRSVRSRDSTSQSTAGNEDDTKVVPRSNEEVEAAKLERSACLHRSCAQCLESITISDQTLYWNTLDFCNEKCLTKYQTTVNAKCKLCNNIVRMKSLIKFCVRFGFDTMQFCSAICLEQFKKAFKVCFYCQQDVSKSTDALMAPVGEKGLFKDFCNQSCLDSLDNICNPKKMYQNCSVCNNEKIVRIEFKLNQREHKFCSNPCFSAFKFVNNFFPDQCTSCQKYFERKKAEHFTLYWDKTTNMFCSKICMTLYINLNRKIVPCEWCKVKKYNFDMIQKNNHSQSVMLCSLNCLTASGAASDKTSAIETKCTNCNRTTKPQYQLSMSDAMLRFFCTYQCAMVYGNRVGTMHRKGSTLHCLGPPSRITAKLQESLVPTAESTADITIVPAIASSPGPTSSPESVVIKPLRKGRARLVNLKPESTGGAQSSSPIPLGETSEDDQPLGRLRSLRSAGTVQNTQSQESSKGHGISSPLQKIITTNSHTQTKQVQKKSIGVNVKSEKMPEDEQSEIPDKAIVTNEISIEGKKPDVSSPGGKIEYKTRVITVPQRQPRVANKQTMCKPLTSSRTMNYRPEMCNVECQTDNDLTKNVLIPIPVPIYVPQPMYMYSLPFPVPVPFPLPIPVPIFIPTTRNSADGIMKEIKKIQDKMPTDPYEAELLMMAEMVADDKKKGDSDSECEHEPAQRAPEYDEVDVAEPANSFGEDVLQMALNMATECDETSAVDLETAMTTSTITPTVPAPHISQDDPDDPSEMPNQMIMIDGQRQIIRGKKRSGSPIAGSTVSSSTKNNRLVPAPVKKKPRHAEPPSIEQLEREVDDAPVKPDTNMCLKYTFGVNAWKQWVMTKNADIEKSSFKRKPFKSELLQLTADELNYSLCLFVKEVRKPNGSEYAPDTIFYLVLGIQQYLFVNGRIDNIFTDPYYERFTDCLDEVAKRFSILYNDSQYIVTRVEEEHLWECKQLGAHSPHVLLSTLMFFNTKHFNLTTVEEHMQLSFSHIMKHWRRSAPGTKPPSSRNVLLRFYPPQSDANPRKKKVYEQQENENNPLRCPVKLYEFYLSKCPESVKTRNDVFYLQPERSCVPDSPVWYSTQPLGREALSKMLHRVKMVKEINIALITS